MKYRFANGTRRVRTGNILADNEGNTTIVDKTLKDGIRCIGGFISNDWTNEWRVIL